MPDEPVDLERHVPFQRRTWAAERIAWVVVSAILLAALLGAFGRGLASRAEGYDPTGQLRVEYQKFERRAAPATVRARISGDAAGTGDTVSLTLNQAFLDSVANLTVLPNPVEWASTSGGSVLRFRTAAPGQPMTISIRFEHTKMGVVRGELALPSRPPVRFTLWVHP